MGTLFLLETHLEVTPWGGQLTVVLEIHFSLEFSIIHTQYAHVYKKGREEGKGKREREGFHVLVSHH